MKKIRLIGRMDIKGPYLVKGIHLEGLRKLGDPNAFARKYYEQGIDELIYIDIVASLYNRNSLKDIVRRTTQDIFIPITVGGGIRSIVDVTDILRSGADKVAINTAAIKEPEIIRAVSQRFGSQCMVLSIEAIKVNEHKWEAYYDNGRERTGIDAVEWARQGYEMGAGEILITSIDKEGTCKGFDVDLVQAISSAVPIPVIASGGMGLVSHLGEVVNRGKADAVAMADVLHYSKLTIPELRQYALSQEIEVRV